MEKYYIEYYMKHIAEANSKEDAERLFRDWYEKDPDYKDARIIHLVEDKKVK